VHMLSFPMPAWSLMATSLQSATLSLTFERIKKQRSMSVTVCSLGANANVLEGYSGMYYAGAGCKEGETVLSEGVFDENSANGAEATIDLTNHVRQLYNMSAGSLEMGGDLVLRLGSSMDNGCSTACDRNCYSNYIKIAANLNLGLSATEVVEPVSSKFVDDSSCHLQYPPFDNGDVLPDFSDVGFRSGRQPFPVATVEKTVSPLDPGQDATTVIQAAIDEVSSMPLSDDGLRGAVLLEPGTYEVASTVYIRASGVVLRGSVSQDGESLSVIIATGTTKYDAVIVDSEAGGGRPRTESNTRAIITDPYVPIGARSFNLDSAAVYAVGDSIMVVRPHTDEWVTYIGMDNISNCVPPAPGRVCKHWSMGQNWDLKFERTITAIDGNLVTVDVPMVQPLDGNYGGGYIEKYTFVQRPTMVGIEDLRFDSTYTGPFDEDHGWSAVVLSVLDQGWVQRIQCLHYAFACVHIKKTAKFITVSDCHSSQPISQITGGRRYSFNVDGSMNLVTKCSARDGRHDYVSGSKVAGPNVFHDSTSLNSYADVGPHHRWGVGQLYDRIVSDGGGDVWNRGSMGSGHGWSGAQIVFWNSQFNAMVVESAPGSRNWAVGCTIPHTPLGPQGTKRLWFWKHPEVPGTADAVTIGQGGKPSARGEWDMVNQEVTPASLYEAQLADRLPDSCGGSR